MTDRPLPETYRSVFLVGPERVELRELPLPEPAAGEILLRVDAATTCGTDAKVYRRGGHPRMLRVPTPFGHEVAGTLVARGRGVDRWPVGERLVVANSASCGTCRYCRRGRENLCTALVYLNGAFAEYLLVPARFAERSVHSIPEGLPAARAALAEPLACVLHGIEMCRITEPQDALVLGAGPIGLLFVAALAAREHRVTLADRNRQRLAAARGLGAARTLEIGDRERAATELRAASASGDGFALAIDATGSVAGWQTVVESTEPGGTVSLFGGCPPGTALALDTRLVHYSELTLIGAYHHRPDNVAEALRLLADGSLAVDHLLSTTRPLEETEEALRSMIRRETLKVVLTPYRQEGPPAPARRR